MPSFNRESANAIKAPFGKNVYLRSTVGVKYESYTLASATFPAAVVDGVPGYKIAQPGTALAKITSGPDAGKIGPFQASGTAELQTLTATGTVSGGSYTLTLGGQVTANIAWNASAAVVQAALEALPNVVPGDVLVAGGAFPGAPLTFTFFGNYIGDAPALSVQTAGLTGSTPGAGFATTTPGVAGAADGRQTVANLVGLLDTFLPWQLMERDVEVAVAYECTAVQAWCFEYNAAGVLVPLSNAAALGMAPRSNATNGGRLSINWA